MGELGIAVVLITAAYIAGQLVWSYGWPDWAAGLFVVSIIAVFFRDALLPGAGILFAVALVRRLRDVDLYQLFRRPPPPPLPVRDTRWDQIKQITGDIDPWKALQICRGAANTETLPIGMGAAGWMETPRQSNCLIIGPPRIGKTSSGLVPQILTAFGPVAAITSKDITLYEPTAQTRARMGQLYHYNPSGDGPTLPGCKELRWSPLAGAADWKIARRTGAAINDTLPGVQGESSSGQFFRLTSGHIVSVVLHGAAIAGKDMEFVLDVMANDATALDELEDIIHASGNRHARRWMQGITNADRKTRDNIMTSAQLCFDAYSFDESVASTVDPNFDPHQFAASDADTIYITASLEEQEVIGPLIVNLLAQIRRARYELWMFDQRQGYDGRVPMFWALDEVTSLARIKRLPQLVSQSADTGLLISAVCQSLSQTESAWGAEGKALMDFFTSVMVFSGIRNPDTLEAVAKLGGKEWIVKTLRSWTEGESLGESLTRGKQGASFSESYTKSSSMTESESIHHVDRFSPGDIHEGNAGDGPGGIIYLKGASVIPLQPMPYYAAAPYREVIIGNAVHSVRKHFDELARIPPPRIRPAGLEPQWAKRYKWAIEQRADTIALLDDIERPGP